MKCPWEVAYQLHKDRYTKERKIDKLIMERLEILYDYK